MDKVFGGYALFVFTGIAIGYLAATSYLAIRLGTAPDYLYLITNAPALWRTRPDLAQQVVLILAGCGLLALFLAARLVTEQLTKMGKTHWQSKAELRRKQFLVKQETGPGSDLGSGFLLAKTSIATKKGKFISSAKYPHCMLVAPTGRGKGTGFVIPNLLTFKGSTVTLDVKSENWEKTARRREAMGDKVFRFAPTLFGVPSHRYNPIKRIAELTNPDEQQFELKKLADLFFQSDNEKNDGLLQGGIKAFVACGMLAFERGTSTLGDIYKLVNGGQGESQKEIYAEYAMQARNPETSAMFASLSREHDKTLATFISMLDTSGFSPWSNAHVCDMTSESDFEFDDLRRVPHSIYFTIRSQDIKPVAGLVRLFFTDLIATLEHHEPDKTTEPWPVMMILDEFHKLGRMAQVAESITTLRSFGGRLAIITQTIPKLEEIYGRNERLSLEGGAGIKVYMTPSEEMTVENLSDACGKTTKRIVSKSRQAGVFDKTTVSERTEEVPLLSQDDARRLDDSDIILIVDADHPIKAKAIRYYEDPVLQPIYEGQSGAYPIEGLSEIEELKRDVAETKEEVKQLKSKDSADATESEGEAPVPLSEEVKAAMTRQINEQMEYAIARIQEVNALRTEPNGNAENGNDGAVEYSAPEDKERAKPEGRGDRGRELNQLKMAAEIDIFSDP